MKSLTIHTLVVAVALTLWGTPSIAANSEMASLQVNSAEQSDRHSAPTATSPAPLYALSRLDAQSLAEQEMTERELRAVEGGSLYFIDLGFMGTAIICPNRNIVYYLPPGS